jgi:UDP-3-O-[3-hydroxymyristoyl] glucosamine N-acyltransferase
MRGQGQICFLDGKNAILLAPELQASAVFCTPDLADAFPSRHGRLHETPQQAFALLARTLYPEANFPQPLFDRRGISPLPYCARRALSKMERC